MKKRIGLCVATALLSALSASAQDKVVVIPLGSSTPASASEAFQIKIYDGNNVFIGYQLDRYFTVNAKKYFTSINSSNGIPHYEPLVSHCLHYRSSDCTGNPYGSTDFYDAKMPLRGAGQVATDTFSHSQEHFYIPLNATPETIAAGQTISFRDWTGSCSGGFVLTESKEVFQLLPNDPSVTGFPNTLVTPYKTVITLPASP